MPMCYESKAITCRFQCQYTMKEKPVLTNCNANVLWKQSHYLQIAMAMCYESKSCYLRMSAQKKEIKSQANAPKSQFLGNKQYS